MIDMFGWLRKKAEQAERGDDCVWMSDAARVEGMRREVERVKAAGSNAVVVAPTMAAFEKMSGTLAPHQPLLCQDRFERGRLQRALQESRAVVVAMPAALPTETQADSNARCDFLVYGRDNARSADDAIVRAADLLGTGVRITFHLSLDDALLQQHGKSLKPVLEKLGMSADESVNSPFLSRAIASAQTK